MSLQYFYVSNIFYTVLGQLQIHFLIPANLRKTFAWAVQYFGIRKKNDREDVYPTNILNAYARNQFFSILASSHILLHIETLLNSMVGKDDSISPLFASQTISIATRFHEIEFTPFSDYWFALLIYFQSRWDFRSNFSIYYANNLACSVSGSI